MTRFKQEVAGKDGWTDWILPVIHNYKMACCDCGLIHKLHFRVKAGRCQFKISRDNRSTAAMRRKKDKPFTEAIEVYDLKNRVGILEAAILGHARSNLQMGASPTELDKKLYNILKIPDIRWFGEDYKPWLDTEQSKT